MQTANKIIYEPTMRIDYTTRDMMALRDRFTNFQILLSASFVGQFKDELGWSFNQSDLSRLVYSHFYPELI